MEPAEAPEAGGRALRVTKALDVLTASGWPLTQVAGLAVGPLCLSLRVWSSLRLSVSSAALGFPSSFLKIVCLFLAVLGPCLRRLFPGCGEQAPLSGCAARPVPCSAFSGGARAPGDRLGSRGPGLSCSAGCGVFWIRGQSYVSRTGR